MLVKMEDEIISTSSNVIIVLSWFKLKLNFKGIYETLSN
jgi:hypothetical protein